MKGVGPGPRRTVSGMLSHSAVASEEEARRAVLQKDRRPVRAVRRPQHGPEPGSDVCDAH